MLYNMDEFDAALELVSSMRHWEGADAAWQAYLDHLEGDILASQGKSLEAAQAYSKALESSPNNSLREASILRLEILRSPAREELMAAVKEKSTASWRYSRAVMIDESWLPRYYLGVQMLSDLEYEVAQENLLECVRRNPSHAFVRRNCYYYLGVCAYRLKRYALAKLNFETAKRISESIFLEQHPAYDGVIPLDRLNTWSAACNDWLRRCEWRETWRGIGGKNVR